MQIVSHTEAPLTTIQPGIAPLKLPFFAALFKVQH